LIFFLLESKMSHINLSAEFILEKLEKYIVNICIDEFGEHKGLKILVPQFNHGHLSTNAPIIFSSTLKITSQEVYDRLNTKLLASCNEILRIDLVSGFMNFWFTDECICEAAQDTLDRQARFHVLNKQKINVEFISANPTGPLHLGHLRGIYGDMLGSFLSFIGHFVTKEYLVNDIGNQIEIFGQSVFYEYSILSNFEYEQPEERYPGQYVKDIARKLYEEGVKYTSWEEVKDELRIYSVRHVLDLIKTELDLMNVHFDVWRFESEIHSLGLVKEAIEILRDREYIEYGVLGEIESGKGKASSESVLLFKANFNDPGKVLVRNNGISTYFATDAGYCLDKSKRGYDWAIMLLGADHASHADYLRVIKDALGTTMRLDIILVQIMLFQLNNEKLKFAKRHGIAISPTEIIDHIGQPELLRFMIASRNPETHCTVDIDELVKISMDNPFYYIQYACARSASILRNATVDASTFNPKSYTKEMNEMLYKLITWQNELRVIESNLQVHRIVQYLHQVCSMFHSIWSKGNSHPENRWITEDKEKTGYRLTLIKLFQTVVFAGLGIIGVQPYEKMDNVVH